jgi:hypothetical protein
VAVDANAAKRQRILDTLSPTATRSWTSGSGSSRLTFTVGNVQIQTLNEREVLSIDMQVSRSGVVWFDDRVNMPNPVTAVRNNSGVAQDNPLAATRATLETVANSATVNFTVPHVMRLPGTNTFLGDTLAVRSSAADGIVTSTNANFNTTLDGSGLSANTAAGTATVACSTGFTVTLLYLDFDTSSLGAGATISAVVPTLYGATTAESNTNTTTIQMRIFNWGGTLTTADWIDMNPSTGWTNLTLVADQSLGGWNQTNNASNSFNDSGLAYNSINKTSPTYMVTGLARIAVGQPTGANSFVTYTADNAGTTSDPLLTVTYTVSYTGTMASTLARALFTGTGSHGQAGSIASTLQAATASLTGSQTQSGTWASTMQAATFTASGAQDGGIEGTLGATLTKATASLTGEQSQTGTWASELQEALFSGTAEQNMTGTWSSTLPPPTFSATGTNAQTGSIAAELQEPTFTATGVMHPDGIMGAVLEELQFSGTATHAQSGAIAVTLQALTAAMTATQTQSGSIVSTLQSALFTATGEQTYTGTMAATLQAATAAFTGLFDIEGIIAWFSYSDLTDTGVIRFTYAEQTDVGEIRFSYSEQTDTGTIKFSFADVTDTGNITFRTEVV